MADEKIVTEAEANIESAPATEAPLWDDAAEEQKFLEARARQIEEDSKKPIDPDALLEVRHLR